MQYSPVDGRSNDVLDLYSGCTRFKSQSSYQLKLNYTRWPESVGELYRPSDRRMSAKFVPTFADRGCHVVSVTDPSDRILGF
jgi:hypothetical protein